MSFREYREIQRRVDETERRTDEKNLRAAALLRAEAERLRTAIDAWRALDQVELPSDVRRIFDEQDVEVFRGSNKQEVLEGAEQCWQKLMDRASRLDWDARVRQAIRDEPRDLGHYFAGAVMWVFLVPCLVVAAVSFLVFFVYLPIAIVVDIVCRILGVEWTPPLL